MQAIAVTPRARGGRAGATSPCPRAGSRSALHVDEPGREAEALRVEDGLGAAAPAASSAMRPALTRRAAGGDAVRDRVHERAFAIQ